MKKILLIVLLAISVSAAGFAQSNNAGVNRTAARPGQSLKNLLSLTNEQEKKVAAIYAGQANAIKSLMAAAKSGKDRNAVMAGLIKLMNEADVKINAILTPVQAAKFQKMIDRRSETMRRIQLRRK